METAVEVQVFLNTLTPINLLLIRSIGNSSWESQYTDSRAFAAVEDAPGDLNHQTAGPLHQEAYGIENKPFEDVENRKVRNLYENIIIHIQYRLDWLRLGGQMCIYRRVCRENKYTAKIMWTRGLEK